MKAIEGISGISFDGSYAMDSPSLCGGSFQSPYSRLLLDACWYIGEGGWGGGW